MVGKEKKVIDLEDELVSDKTKNSSRYEVQKRRAIGAVVIMLVISALLIGSVELMYCFARGNADVAQGNYTSEVADEVSNRLLEIADDSSIDPFYVLIIGSDSRRGTALYTGKEDGHAQVDQHADIMTLMRVDPTDYLITFVTIPRDTQTVGGTGKVNDSLLNNDPLEVVAATETITGVEIDYYMMVNFIGFEDFIDGISGVSLSVPADLSLKDPLTNQKVILKKNSSSTLLDGAQALVLARARDEYEDNQDAYRQLNVRRIEVAIAKKVLSSFSERNMDQVLALVNENIKTNISYEFSIRVLKRFIDNEQLVTYFSGTGPYEGGMDEDGLWVVPPDKETWETVMNVVDSGGDPADIVEQVKFSDLE